jgi:hypothetical protein
MTIHIAPSTNRPNDAANWTHKTYQFKMASKSLLFLTQATRKKNNKWENEEKKNTTLAIYWIRYSVGD